MHRIVFLSLLISAAAMAADKPAPPLHFEAGVVLAGGYVLASTVTLPPVPGPVTLPTREGTALHWRVTVQDGETQLLQQDGHWAARAEYNHTLREGRTVCLVYQTTLSPEWAVHGRDRQDHADIAVADDKVYSFREVPCP
ncbi:hypothetical protein [Ferrovibrio xuzhouensis]|uniref:Uncharacterized protein n=1 Tax=Ferrovibrio xuzhouensis TaxID=1576914 RepID=A0ABV7VA87_9PROT